jgi:two-component system, chemotaxis family, protein-glutamate methylesterase/glutaminase
MVEPAKGESVPGDGQRNGHGVIVIGASAGGVEALRNIAAGLPEDLASSVFVVLHLPPGGTSVLPAILARAGDLPASHPTDGEKIENGHIYVAPPDNHMLIEDGVVRLARGPRENGHRPAIDPLFRSAARSHGARVIGVILSGVLDDGTAGLAAVKAAGGRTVVQDPADALYPAMPESAIAYVTPEHVLETTAIAPLLSELAGQAPPEAPEVWAEPELVLEETLVAADRSASDAPQPGEPSGFTCPECSGALWQADEDGVPRFRCRTGHQFSLETLLAAQSDSIEAALWSAVRALEERSAMLRRVAQRMSSRGNTSAAFRYARQADQGIQHALALRHALHNLHAAGTEDDEGAEEDVVQLS